MKAAAVTPGQARSLRVVETPKPSVDHVPDGRGVLVRVLRVGLCGTDREINEALYGAAPPGDDKLIIGHENLGVVEAVGPNVPPTLRPGTHVVATVRRPGRSVYDAIGRQDITTDDVYYERGINLLHGFLAEYYVEQPEHLIPLPPTLSAVGVLLEPLSVVEKGLEFADAIQRRLRVWRPQRAAVIGLGPIGLLATLALRARGFAVTAISRRERNHLNADLAEAIGATYVSNNGTTIPAISADYGPFDLIFEATGYSPIVFEAALALAKNGVLVLSSVTGGDKTATVETDKINQAFVLGNRVMVGTVNAGPEHFRMGVDDLIKAELLYPDWLDQLLTTKIDGFDCAAIVHALETNRTAIKMFVEVSR